MPGKALIITGRLVQDHEYIYPYYRLQEEGYEVDVAVRGKETVLASIGVRVEPTKDIPDLKVSDYDVLVLPGSEVHADAGCNVHPLHALDLARLAQELDGGRVVGVEELADSGVHAREPATDRFDLRLGAAHAVHVGRGAADVADDSVPPGRVGHCLHFAQDARLGAALDGPALVHGDRAERTAAKAASHHGHAGLDRLDRPTPVPSTRTQEYKRTGLHAVARGSLFVQ